MGLLFVPETQDAQDFYTSASFLAIPNDDSEASVLKRCLWSHLSPLHRALIATDGSFTLLLAALHGEQIKIKMLSQSTQMIRQNNDSMHLESGDRVLWRRVLLMTAQSDLPVVYAESSIVLTRLSKPAKQQLVEGFQPIGLVIRSYGLETYRTLHDWGKCPPNHHASNYLGASDLMFRTYTITAHGLPIMCVSEYFPYKKQLPDSHT